MGTKEVREEFKEFVKELSIEICTNVCLDKITEINDEFRKNNEKLMNVTSNIDDTLENNRNNIVKINAENNKQIQHIADYCDTIAKDIAEEFIDFLDEKKDEITNISNRSRSEFESTYNNFKSLFEKSLKNQVKLDENNKNIKKYTEKVNESSNSLKEALVIVNKSNKEYLMNLEKKNEALFNKYNTAVQKLNTDERQIFIKSISNAIVKERDEFSNTIIKNIDSYISKVLEDLNRINNENNEFIKNTLSKNMDINKLNNIESELLAISDIVKNQKNVTDITKKKVEDMKDGFKSVNKELSSNILKVSNENREIKSKLNQIEEVLYDINEKYTKIENQNKLIMILIICAIFLGLIF